MNPLTSLIISLFLGGVFGVQNQATVPLRDQLSSDLKRLSAASSEIEALVDEMGDLSRTFKETASQDLSEEENRKIESLHFRYSILQNSLWDVVERYSDDVSELSGGDNQAKAFVLSLNAALNLVYSNTALVGNFIDQPKVILKFNQPHPETEIPDGTFNRVLKNLMSVDNINKLKTAWFLFEDEKNTPHSPLNTLSETDPEYSKIVLQNETLYLQTDQQIEQLVEDRSNLFDVAKDRLRQTSISDLARKSKEVLGDNFDSARKIFNERREKSKSAKKKDFVATEEQYLQIKELIEPGDIMLTYSSGHMSNIFIPGTFKHAITYVGSPEQRKVLGVPDLPFQTPKSKLKKLEEDLARTHLDSGELADLVEAVAEGVVFNSLKNITTDKVNRLLILRPNLSRKERARDLTTVFLQLDKKYDYRFDFNDPIRQCCTEVLFRAINHMGSITFKLTRRMGLPTLSADDIIKDFINQTKPAFEFVLLAEHDISKTGNSAVVLTGDSGLERLNKLMSD